MNKSLRRDYSEGFHTVLPSMTVNPVLSTMEVSQMSETGRGWTRPRKIHSVVFHWSRKEAGMNMSGAAAAWTALHRRTNQIPVIHKSGKSVASWRLRQGDATGVSVTLHGRKASKVRRTTLRGIPVSNVVRLTDNVDKTYQRCSFSIEKPRRRPQLEPHYELLRTRTSVPGLSVTVCLKDHVSSSNDDVTSSRRGWLIQDRSSRLGETKQKQ